MSHTIEIVNIKNCRDFGTIEGDVYIGRYNPRFGTSPFANPYTIVYNRDDVINKYTRYFNKKLIDQIDDLVDACRLGCWCRPLRCHGEVILDAIQNKYGGERKDRFTLVI